MANNSISLILLALDRYGGDVFHMTLISSGSYEAALQEVLGLGRVMLKNDRAVVRVEIYRDMVTSGAPLVILTHDDIFLEERRQKKSSIWRFSTLRRLLR